MCTVFCKTTTQNYHFYGHDDNASLQQCIRLQFSILQFSMQRRSYQKKGILRQSCSVLKKMGESQESQDNRFFNCLLSSEDFVLILIVSAATLSGKCSEGEYISPYPGLRDPLSSLSILHLCFRG